MCFDTDNVDWYAAVQTDEVVIRTKPRQCTECGREIAVGHWSREITQQEHEECVLCYEICPNDDDTKTPHEGECDYGESYDYCRCLDCEHLLSAIEAVEIDEGCPPHAQRPPLGVLHEELYQHEGRYTYAERAVSMFPELWEHPFIVGILEWSTCGLAN